MSSGPIRVGLSPLTATRSKPYILDYPPPVEVKRKCEHCEQPLGVQNPGWICGTCAYITGA